MSQYVCEHVVSDRIAICEEGVLNHFPYFPVVFSRRPQKGSSYWVSQQITTTKKQIILSTGFEYSLCFHRLFCMLN
jgi:hypothetical protein